MRTKPPRCLLQSRIWNLLIVCWYPREPETASASSSLTSTPRPWIPCGDYLSPSPLMILEPSEKPSWSDTDNSTFPVLATSTHSPRDSALPCWSQSIPLQFFRQGQSKVVATYSKWTLETGIVQIEMCYKYEACMQFQRQYKIKHKNYCINNFLLTTNWNDNILDIFD